MSRAENPTREALDGRVGCYGFSGPGAVNALSSRRGVWGCKKSSSITFCSPEVSYLGAGKIEVDFAVSLVINGYRDSQRDSPAGLSVTHQGGSSCTCPYIPHDTTFHSVCIRQ